MRWIFKTENNKNNIFYNTGYYFSLINLFKNTALYCQMLLNTISKYINTSKTYVYDTNYKTKHNILDQFKEKNYMIYNRHTSTLLIGIK